MKKKSKTTKIESKILSLFTDRESVSMKEIHESVFALANGKEELDARIVKSRINSIVVNMAKSSKLARVSHGNYTLAKNNKRKDSILNNSSYAELFSPFRL